MKEGEVNYRYVLRYKVEAYSDENENETNIYQGTLLADYYKEAMEYLICQYGKKELVDIFFEWSKK